MKQIKRKVLIFLLEQVIKFARCSDIKDNLLWQGLRDIKIWIVRERKR